MKNTKAYRVMVGILVIFAIALFVLVACNPDPGHVHQWGAWSTTIPVTCTTTGSQTRTCVLDATHTDTREIAIDPNAHDYQNYSQTTAPTCLVDGEKEAVCARDNTHAKSTLPIIALGHNIAAGAYLCSVCNNPYELGDNGPGGGKIFYRSETGFTMTDDNSLAHYLEVAPADMSTGLPWASTLFSETNITGLEEAIGTGRKNTTIILATDTNAPASLACNEYSNNGLSDWFLPSKDELNQLYQNKALITNLVSRVYWSSCQNSPWQGMFIDAVGLFFDNGFFGGRTKLNSDSVRAVRAF